LERLEIRLDQLRQENAHLRQENNEWRNKYDILEKSLGDLQAEYASLCRVSQTSSGGSSGDSSSSSSLNQSSLLSPSATTAEHGVLPKSSKQQTSALPLQQSLLSTTSSSRFSNVTSKISLLRKSQHPTDRIVLQKPITGNTGGVSLLGSGSRFLPVIGSSGSNVTLSCGVRKKVTTSLFILACLFAINCSVIPFGQLSSPSSVVAIASEYDNPILKPSITSRVLFSVPVTSGNLSEATAAGQQARKNSTNITPVSDKPSVNVTAAVVTEIGRCHPDEVIDLMNQQVRP
uniref:Nuclear distribution protein nudE-like 1-A n=1 Tax=Rodentolepis nana TaxID=102285 RepID=A0A0R3TCW3_RODNA